MNQSASRASVLLLACFIAYTASAAVCVADGVGVMLAPAGDRMVQQEAQLAEAVVAELVAEGRRAAFLHEASPLVRSARVKLPSVHLEDDWTPLADVLDRVATRMRLDYIILTGVETVGEELSARALVVVRGGESTRVSDAAGADASAVAFSLVGQTLDAMQQLPPPRDRQEEALPLDRPETSPSDQSEASEQAATADQQADDAAAQDDETPEPLAVADEPAEPETSEAPGEPQPVDDALAAAEAAYERGEMADAEKLLAASLRETGPSARAYLLEALLALAEQDRDDAIGTLKRAVARDPSLADAQVWLGRLLAEKGLWQEAQDHYQRAIEAEPTHLEGLLGLARLYRDHGHRRKAIRLLTEARDKGQDAPSVLMLLAELHVAEGKVELAERYYVQAARASEGDQQAAAWERLADLYVELNRHRDALQCYAEAAELNPSRASMVKRRYAEVMAAADGSVHQALSEGWSAFEDFAVDGIGQREIVYRHVAEMQKQLEEAMEFVDSISPPKDLREEHIQRQFAYSLAVESSVLVLSWLDLGDEIMLERAREAHTDALREFRALGTDARG